MYLQLVAEYTSNDGIAFVAILCCACVMDSFMVDAADYGNLELAKNELFALLDKPTMAGIPVLVLGNKCDLPAALDDKQLTDKMYVLNCASPNFLNLRVYSVLDNIFIILVVLLFCLPLLVRKSACA